MIHHAHGVVSSTALVAAKEHSVSLLLLQTVLHRGHQRIIALKEQIAETQDELQHCEDVLAGRQPAIQLQQVRPPNCQFCQLHQLLR